MSKFISWLNSLFTTIGSIWSTLKSSKAGSVVIATLNNSTFNSKAMEIVESLQDSDLSGSEKEAKFNELFNAFCDAKGYTVSKNLVNCLRELALAAIQTRAS